MVTCAVCGHVATKSRLRDQWRREARPRSFRYVCMACGGVMLVKATPSGVFGVKGDAGASFPAPVFPEGLGAGDERGQE